MAALAAIAIVLVSWLVGRRFRDPSPAPLPRLADGRIEGCLACHAGVRGLGAAHDVATIGCSSCHLGDAQARDAEGAHRGMEILSGDLSTVFATCGRGECHVTESARVITSLMARAPGILEVDRFAFGERPTPDDRPGGFPDLNGDRPARSPAESHARKLCGSCHLAMRKARPGDDGFFARGGGCAACHLAPPDSLGSQGTGRLHPDVSAAVSEKRCEGCHSRSGRIAMSYRGVVELEPTDARVTSHLPDGRPIGVAPPDVHAKAGLTCIDCHTERELMGDGKSHRHAHEAVDIRCSDCHSPVAGSRLTAAPQPTAGAPPSTTPQFTASASSRAGAPPTASMSASSSASAPLTASMNASSSAGAPPTAGAPDEDAARVVGLLRKAWLRRHMPALPEGGSLRTSGGVELWRTGVTERGRVLALATNGEHRAIPAASERAHHTLPGHARLSCQACHSQWTPRCTKCHTTFDPLGEDVDHLLGVATKGRWIEVAGGNAFGPPLLAVGPRGTIDPFTEGMTLRIDGLEGAPPIDRTLWAPLEPHTTGPARTCASCHGEPAIDETYPKAGDTTRTGARLLDERERARIARVGRCIGCHPGYEAPVYADFAASLRRLAEKAVPKCGGDPG